jgi:DNA adenine methylase
MSAIEKYPNVFLYLDPPYVFMQAPLYRQKEFDHNALADFLLSLPSSVGWLLSYDDAPIVRALYSGKQGISVDGYRPPRGYVSGGRNTDASLVGDELFISNF